MKLIGLVLCRYWVSKKQYWCKYCNIWIRDDAPVSQFTTTSIISTQAYFFTLSLEDNMKQVLSISATKRDSSEIFIEEERRRKRKNPRKLPRWLV